MRIPVAGLVGVALVLSLTAPAWADIPPPPPVELTYFHGLRPLPIAVAGLAASLAVATAGVIVARSRGRSGIRAAALLVAAVVLVAAGVVAFRAAAYQKTLANWHPNGPVRLPRVYREAPSAVAVFAAAPQSGFPHNLPWAALAVNGSGPSNAEVYP